MDYRKVQTDDDQYYPQKKLKLAYDYNLLLNVEPNVSYTRGNESGYTRENGNGTTSTVKTKEDEQFLKLAKEALVATASTSSNLVDPTINDLLTRLQYASSPHGNPIKKSDDITINDSGQLNIQEFYQSFPNLSNDVFKEKDFSENHHFKEKDFSENHHPTNNSQGWNFLIPKEDEKEKENDELDKSLDRKFHCVSCVQTFKRSLDLKRHEKQHLIIPPSICNLCGKGFARKDALKRHRGTLTCKRNFDKKLYLDNLQFLEK